jgi:hypothetical protein
VKMRFVSLSLLTICMLAAVPALADETLYFNGTVTATGGAHDYNTKSPYSISDPFTVPNSSDIETLSIEYWDHSNTVVLSSLQMAIGSTAFGGSFETISPDAGSNTLLNGGVANSHGYYLVVADFTFTSIDWSGAGWITLENAICGTGCTVLWDASDPNLDAYNSSTGGLAKASIYGETFSLDGEITPEPSSLLLLGSGLLGLAGVLRRKLAR